MCALSPAGIRGMKAGGKRRLLVPQNLAPPGVTLPPGVPLTYAIPGPGPDPGPVPFSPSPDSTSWSLLRILSPTPHDLTLPRFDLELTEVLNSYL